jgi:hypothetical protein
VELLNELARKKIHRLYDQAKDSDMPFPRSLFNRFFTSAEKPSWQKSSFLCLSLCFSPSQRPADANYKRALLERRNVRASQAEAILMSGILDVDHVRMLKLSFPTQLVHHLHLGC